MAEDTNPIEAEALPPLTPQNVEAREAHSLLERAISQFIDYRNRQRDPETVRHVLIRSPAGLGKTTSCVDLAVDYIVEETSRPVLERTWGEFDTDWDPKWAFYVRTHALAKELENTIVEKYAENDENPSVVIYRGRAHEAAIGNAPCFKHREALILSNRGLSVTSNLCQRKSEENVTIKCDDFERCEYLETRRRKPRFAILMSAELPSARGSSLRDIERQGPPGESHFFKPIEDVSTFVVDESPIDWLKYDSTIPGRVFDTIDHPQLRSTLRNALNNDSLLDLLREIPGFLAVLRRESEIQKAKESEAGSLVLRRDHIFEEFEAALGDRQNFRISDVIENLIVELNSGRAGKSYSLRSGQVEGGLIAQGRQRFPLAQTPGLFLDATANETLLRAFVPSIELAADIHVRRNAYITQVTIKSFSKFSLLRDRNRASVRQEIDTFIQAVNRSVYERTGGEGRTLVVTYKDFRRTLTREVPHVGGVFGTIPETNVDVAHFGNIRGIDEFKDHEAVIIIGRQEPSPKVIEEDAMAIWFDTSEPIEELAPGEGLPRRKGWFLVDGLPAQPTNERGASYHPDDRVQALLENVREAESLQAIDRLRLVHNENQKQVYILCNLPLPNLVLNRILTWRELLDGGAKLERVL